MNFILHAKCTSLSLTFCTPPFPTSGTLIKGTSQVSVGFSVEVEIVLLRTHEVKRNVGKGTPTNRIMWNIASVVDVQGSALCHGSIACVPLTLTEVYLSKSITVDGQLKESV